MSALSPKTRDLIARGRGAPPSAADRARVRAKLDERLALLAAAGVLAGAGTAASTATASTVASTAAVSAPAAGAGTAVAVAQSSTFGVWLKIGIAALVLGGAGITVQTVRSHRADPAVASASATVLAIDTASTTDATPPAPLAEAPSAAPPEDTAAPSDSAPMDGASVSPSADSVASGGSSARAPRPRDPASIAAEVALLRRAQSALAKGDPNASLRAIDAIQSSHASGALREETSAARVLALCAAGKKPEAKAEAARFLAQWPSSVQAGRVRGSCAFARDGASD